MRHILIIALVAAVATTAHAQIGFYTIAGTGFDNCSAIGYTSYTQIYLIVTGEWRGARFSIPQDQVAFPDYQAITPLNGATVTGDLDHGFEMTFPATTSGRTVVGTVTAFSYGLPCSEVRIGPHPMAETGKVELIDRAGHTIAATWVPTVHVQDWLTFSYCENIPAMSPPPRDPFPRDTAIDVGTSIDLAWVIDQPYGNCGDISGRRASVYFGTTPNPPAIAGDLEASTFHVGPLQPGMTYYWKLVIWNYGPVAYGPVWSFKTAMPVAIRPTTWGHIKALYRP